MLHILGKPTPAFEVNYDPNRPPSNLSVLMDDGRKIALPYRNLTEISLDPPNWLQIRFGVRSVRIEGQNLQSLFDAIQLNSVKSIQINTKQQGEDADSQTTMIWRISVTAAS